MNKKKLSVAVVGAGMGGLAVAATLRRVGIDVAGLRAGAALRAHRRRHPDDAEFDEGAARHRHRGTAAQDVVRAVFASQSRRHTGEITRELPMPESLYGAPYLCMHRADLHDALASARAGRDRPSRQEAGRSRSRSADKSRCVSRTARSATADAVVGADGVHSIVRDIVVGPDEPIHKGRIAYRAVFPAKLMGGFDIGPSRTKWWGTDRHIVIYYTTKTKSEVYFVTSVPEPAEWLTRESWSAKGDVKELRAAYEGFHQDVRNVLEACPDCHKWAILEREPLPRWSDGRVVLLGDAAHPMTPYMAQGAATSIEDAAILARCLDAVNGEDIEGAFKRYEAHRKPRTSRGAGDLQRQHLDARRARRRHELALRLRRLERESRSARRPSAGTGSLASVTRSLDRHVMPGLVPGMTCLMFSKAWMAGTGPAMTEETYGPP